MPDWLKNKGQELAGLVMEDETAFMTSAIIDSLENLQAGDNSKFQEDSQRIFMNQETAFVTIDAKDTLETIQDDIDTNRQEEDFKDMPVLLTRDHDDSDDSSDEDLSLIHI